MKTLSPRLGAADHQPASAPGEPRGACSPGARISLSPRMLAQRRAIQWALGTRPATLASRHTHSAPVIQRVGADELLPSIDPDMGDPASVVQLFEQWLLLGYRNTLDSLSLLQAQRLLYPFQQWFYKNLQEPYRGGLYVYQASPGVMRVAPVAHATHANSDGEPPSGMEMDEDSPAVLLDEGTSEEEATQEPAYAAEPVPVMALYRGLHYGDVEFAGKQGEAFEEEVRLQTLASPAAAKLIRGGDIDEEAAVHRIQEDMAALYRDEETIKWWNNQKGSFTKPIFALIQRYVMSFREFQVESILGHRSLSERYAAFWASDHLNKKRPEIVSQVLTEMFGLPPLNKDQLAVVQNVLKNLYKYSRKAMFESGHKSNLRRLQDAVKTRQHMQDPFLSTTFKALQAAKYALGNKITKPDDKLQRGIVGSVCVYLMSSRDFRKKYSDALDVERLRDEKHVEFNSRTGQEGEITFVGGIDANDYLGKVDAKAGDSANVLAREAETEAERVAPAVNARVVRNVTDVSVRKQLMSKLKV